MHKKKRKISPDLIKDRIRKLLVEDEDLEQSIECLECWCNDHGVCESIRQTLLFPLFSFYIRTLFRSGKDSQALHWMKRSLRYSDSLNSLWKLTRFHNQSELCDDEDVDLHQLAHLTCSSIENLTPLSHTAPPNTTTTKRAHWEKLLFQREFQQDKTYYPNCCAHLLDPFVGFDTGLTSTKSNPITRNTTTPSPQCLPNLSIAPSYEDATSTFK